MILAAIVLPWPLSGEKWTDEDMHQAFVAGQVSGYVICSKYPLGPLSVSKAAAGLDQTNFMRNYCHANQN
jgi:hypothetical protein